MGWRESLPIDFPNDKTWQEGFLEFPLLRSPKGETFGGSTIPQDNPDWVVFRLEAGTVHTFMGVMSHAGNEHQGFRKREFVASGFHF